MAPDESSTHFEVGDEFSVLIWGRLTKEQIAHHGVAILVGLLRAWHASCPMPYHFWCSPPDEGVFFRADLYQAGGEQGEHYIGCYLSGGGIDDQGEFVLDVRPSFKILMQPLDNGLVLAHFGTIDTERSEEAIGIGLVDRTTVEFITVTPARLPKIPVSAGDTTSYSFQRVENVWHIAYPPGGYTHSEGYVHPGTVQLELIGSFPAPEEPSPLTRIEL